MGLFDKITEPVFLKSSSQAEEQIEQMKELLSKLSGERKEQLEQDMKYLALGIAGEKSIEFELQNSHMPMVILHDLYLEFGGLNAQIDYLVVTRARTFVIECKNLFGNIEINSRGDFIRNVEYNHHVKKQGIYSPITQNERHLQLIKELRMNECNFIGKKLFERSFEREFRSVVVLANPKTILNDKYAKKEIKEKVIRADQLIAYIKKVNQEPDAVKIKEDDMMMFGKYYLSKHQVNSMDYLKKYEDSLEKVNETEISSAEKVEKAAEVMLEKEPEVAACSEEIESLKEVKSADDKDSLIAQLKNYRLMQSREEKIKPYFIFNDAQMADLIEKAPKNQEDLLTVSGFGPVKVKKYGEAILQILTH